MKSKLSLSFDPGAEGNRIAVIFQCPGRDEACAEPPHPAAGETGVNLRALMDFLRSQLKDSHLVDDFCYDEKRPQKGVMVCNAHKLAYYVGSSNGEKPDYVECLQVKSVGRHIKDKDLVICLGKDAAECYDRICSCGLIAQHKKGQKVVKCCHIGMRGLNRTMPKMLLQRIQDGVNDSPNARLLLVGRYIAEVVNGTIPAVVSLTRWLMCRANGDCA